jgi:glycerol-3-phosphate responsive antiterminator
MIGAGFSAKESMSITYIFLMGGAVASIYKNFNRLQPNKQTLVMDYDMIMVTLPMAATGSLFGVC